MATKTISMTFPESILRLQQQTINVQDIGEPITLAVNTGTASYSISGRDLTVTCSNGAPVRTDKEYKYDATGYYTREDTFFPATYTYDDGYYHGEIPKSGSPYSIGVSPPSTLYGVTSTQSATLTWRFRWTGNSWAYADSWVSPSSIPFASGGYSGTLYASRWLTDTPNYPPNSDGYGQPVGTTTTRSISGYCEYKGDITAPGVETYRQDYYGTVAHDIPYYAYSVQVTYTQVLRRPSDFVWTYPKTSGGDFNLTASEWDTLMERINDFREYKSRNRSTYTTAFAGNTFYDYIFNEAVNMLAVINSDLPATVSSGLTVYASELNKLRDSLNAVQ